jgi:protein SCO1
LAQAWRIGLGVVLAAGLAGGIDRIPRGMLANLLWVTPTVVAASELADSQVPQQPADQSYQETVRQYRVPDLTLTDMNGGTMRLGAALRDPGPIVLEFMYTTCAGVCPITSALLAQAQSELAVGHADLRIWSISIDPDADTPARLQLYAQSYGAGPNWRFFTGGLDDIVTLQAAFDAYRGSKMRHEPLILIRAHGDQWARVNGLPSASELVDEFRRVILP